MLPTTDELQGRAPLATDARLEAVIGTLLSRAIRRQVWLFYLDPRQCLIDPIMPMDDHPLRHDDLVQTDDLGCVTFSEALISRAMDIAELVGAGSLVVVWERSGEEKFTADDLAWVRSFVDAADLSPHPCRLRCVFLLHDHGVRQVSPDDYL